MKRRNKHISLAALSLALLLALTACGSTQSPSSSEQKPAAKDFYVKVATGQSGGTYYPVGIALVQVYSDKIPGCISSAMATGGLWTT